MASVPAARALRLRLGQYGRLLGIVMPAAVFALALAWCWWTPLPGSAHAFRNIDLPPEVAGLWETTVSPVVRPGIHPLDVLKSLSSLALLGIAAAIIAVWVGRRHVRLVTTGGAVLFLIFTIDAHIQAREGDMHARIEDASRAKLAALVMAEPRLQTVYIAGPPPGELDGRLLPTDGHFSGADLTRLDGLPTHSIQYKTADGEGPDTLYVDGRRVWFPPADAAVSVPPGTAKAAIYYALAQAAYLRGDAAEVRRELRAIVAQDLIPHAGMAWRVAVMREWVDSQQPVGPGHGFVGLLRLDIQRLLAWGLCAVGLGLGTLGLAIAGLSLSLRRRIDRLDSLDERRCILVGMAR